MASSQERMLTERPQLDIWSTREKLALASAVVRNGDQDWAVISHTCKEFAEPGRPQDWFSQMNCALQYAALLETAEMPKRKKRNKSGNIDKKDDEKESLRDKIVRILTQERCAELQRSMAEKRAKYLRLKEEIALIDSGQADDRLEEWAQQSENERKQKEIDAQNHALWLKEREEKNAQLQATGRLLLVPPPKRKIPVAESDQVISPNVNQPELGHAVNSQLKTPLNVDILAAEADVPNQSIPTSPLLLSLLKTSSSVVTPQISSTLHDAALSQCDASQMTGSQLSLSQGVRLVPQAQITSPREPTSSNVGPTHSIMSDMAGNNPAKPLFGLDSTLIEPNPKPGGVHHPQYQEMRVSNETESDELLEVVEVEPHVEVEGNRNSDAIDSDLEEILADLVATETDAGQQSCERVAFVDYSYENLALLSSVLRSVHIANVKSSDSTRNVFENISEVSTEQTKDQRLVVENDGANVIDGESSMAAEEINPIEKGSQLTEKLNSQADILPDSWDTVQIEPEAVVEKADNQTEGTDETLSPQKLCSKEVIQIDKVKETKVEKVLKEKDVDVKSEKEINPRLSRNKSSENVNKNVQKMSTNPKPLDKFDEMVNEGLPKRKDPKINKSKVSEICVTNNEVNGEEIVCETGANEPTEGMLDTNELKHEQSENVPSNKVEAYNEEETPKLQEQKTAVKEEEEEAKDPDILLPRGFKLQGEDSHNTGFKQESSTENGIETLSETNDSDHSLLHIQSSSHGSSILGTDSIPNSPALILTEDEREYRAWKKAIMLVWSQINSHKYSSIFLRPISNDQAPHYSSRVKRPIDLLTIKKNIETGTTRCTKDFQRDILLMFVNAQMYNSSKHDVHNMAKEMQEDSIQLIKDFMETQKIVQSANETTALRRETRTTGPDAQRRDDSDGPPTPLSFKRKRISDLEKGGSKKTKHVDSPSQ